MDKYRWETRIVTRDGMVSFDGVRYGVPWPYSGLAEKNGSPTPFPCASKQNGAVEVRKLSVYDQLLGGAFHG